MLEFSVAEIIYALLNFTVLVVLLRKFLYKPITGMLDKRQTAIDEALSSAEAARKEVAATEENLRAEIARARTEAESILSDARSRGEAVREEIVAAAAVEAQALVANARAEIENEKNRAIADLKGQIADIALLATEKLLIGGLTESQEKALLDQYINEVGQLQ